MPETRIEKSYALAKERCAELGVDTEAAIAAADEVPLSIHCWQGDDVGGFEHEGATLSGGGIQATGNYPGKARNPAELRADLEEVLRDVPGAKRVNLHASYGEFGGKAVDRDAIEGSPLLGLDRLGEGERRHASTSTRLSFPIPSPPTATRSRTEIPRSAPSGSSTRSAPAASPRRWAAAQGSPCVHNLWIPDGAKDSPVDKAGYRGRLLESLDAIYAEALPERELEDAIEGKLFGIGSESFVVGSHEFYLGYAATRRQIRHPRHGPLPPHRERRRQDQLGPALRPRRPPPRQPRRPLGLRPRRHLTDELADLCRELVRSGALSRVRVGLDYFDASINRVGAWAIGARSARKALLAAFLEPRAALLAADGAAAGPPTASPGWPSSRRPSPFPGAPSGTSTAGAPASPSIPPSSPRCKAYERDVLAKRG